MTVNFESLSNVLKHSMRRKIVLLLYEKKSLAYVDLMHLVEATNTGKFNYHLKILGDLISKDQDGKYVLTEKGQLIAEFVRKTPEQKPQQTALRTADAVLIGFAGTVLSVANPMFWGVALLVSFGLEFTVTLFSVIGLFSFIYALLVPGIVMWLLTIRRTHSHDAYDLYKPPFVSFVLMLLILLVMYLLEFTLTVTLTTPPTSNPDGSTSYSMMQTSLATFLIAGLAFSFAGVAIAESANRLRKRIT